ncbi:GGDEF domain-containing protein [Geotalea sp. SG265]|uniref:GGDEF domain-containing protein n=1 Tax=Geotalea sp. SG265 TaxID=2922867 RepID=UPI001FAF83B7|nr:GGDEF domain-containing protein [Geotalea sp. SG265]
MEKEQMLSSAENGDRFGPAGVNDDVATQGPNLIRQLNEALFLTKFMGAVNASLDPDDVCAIASRVLFDFIAYRRIVFTLSLDGGCKTFTFSPQEEKLAEESFRRATRCFTFQLPEKIGKVEICLDREAVGSFSRPFLAAVTENFAQALKNSMEFYRVKELAMRDGLTGLYNRRVFDEILTIEGGLHKLMPLSLLLLDMDDFKQVNDTFGHAAGDQVLATFGTILRESCRGADLVARYGGEEFAIILPATPSTKATEIAQRMRMRFAATTFAFEGQHFCQTVSIGIACTFDTKKIPISELVHRADMALYRAKREGKNRVCIHTEKSNALAKACRKTPETVSEALLVAGNL